VGRIDKQNDFRNFEFKADIFFSMWIIRYYVLFLQNQNFLSHTSVSPTKAVGKTLSKKVVS